MQTRCGSPMQVKAAGCVGKERVRRRRMQAQALQALRAELMDFLEAAIHCMVFVRALYPSTIFERRYKYGTTIFMSRHPDLNLYIHEVLESAREMFMEDAVARLMVCFYGPDGAAVESFVVDIVNSSSNSATGPGLDTKERMERFFRTMLTRVLSAEAKLSELPEGSTFSIVLFTRDSAQPTQGVTKAVGGGEWLTAGPESFPSTLDAGVQVNPLYSCTLDGGIKLEMKLVSSSSE